MGIPSGTKSKNWRQQDPRRSRLAPTRSNCSTWREARPKALRWSIFHAPARLAHRARRRIVRIADGWPTAEVLVLAYRRIELLT